MAAEEARWKVVLVKSAWKDFDKAPKPLQAGLEGCFAELGRSPYRGPNVRPLTGPLRGKYRYRVGEWRIIYRLVEEARTVQVLAILPRGDAYR